MKYIEIQNRIVETSKIKSVIIDEKDRELIIGYGEYEGFRISYEDVKDNINDEKTELQKDYEKIRKELIPEKESEENKIKGLENQIEMYKITLNNISSDVSKYKQNLRNIVNSKEFSHKKIQKIKEVI